MATSRSSSAQDHQIPILIGTHSDTQFDPSTQERIRTPLGFDTDEELSPTKVGHNTEVREKKIKEKGKEI